MSEEMDRWVRARAGNPPAGEDPGQDLDLERAAELAERLKIPVREAIDLVARHRSRAAAPGESGRFDMDAWLRAQAGISGGNNESDAV